MKKKNNKIKFTAGEKFLFVGVSVLLFSFLFITVISSSMEGNLKMSLEKLNYQISNQKKQNESLQMQVNELTSYDKIKDIVKDMGLSYNNENIIIIEK